MNWAKISESSFRTVGRNLKSFVSLDREHIKICITFYTLYLLTKYLNVVLETNPITEFLFTIIYMNSIFFNDNHFV